MNAKFILSTFTWGVIWGVLAAEIGIRASEPVYWLVFLSGFLLLQKLTWNKR